MANQDKLDKQGAFLPTPEEIAERCEEIRALRGTPGAIGNGRGSVPGGTPAQQPRRAGIKSYRSVSSRNGTRSFELE